MKVSDIEATASDSAGAKIEAVYAKYDPDYAVYRTGERVLVQFADAPETEKTQRATLSTLNPIRGEINHPSLQTGWRIGFNSIARGKISTFSDTPGT